MLRIPSAAVVLAVALLAACGSDNGTGSDGGTGLGGGGGSTPTTGQLAVWTDYAGGQINVSVDGAFQGTLTQYFANTIPACGQSGTLLLTLSPGVHTISGISGSLSWNGTATVVAGGCSLDHMSAPAAPATGQLSIWTNFSSQITVKVDGVTVGTTTQYFPTGTPTCGGTGTITVTLTAGQHTISAVSGTTTWNGPATVTAGLCGLFELTAP